MTTWADKFIPKYPPEYYNENESIDFIESMKVLKYEPDDIVVLKTSYILSKEAHGNLRKSMGSIIGDDIKVMILEEGMDIGVLRVEANNGS